ncbi:MAG: S-layer homology domain-containing protein [Eubacteriales bacterium]
MRKRILSILISVCMVLSLLPTVALASPISYGIWVGSTQVTSENMDNVLGDTGTPTVTYDADQNILTLNNANIITTKSLDSSLYKFAITRDLSYPLGLNINLIGNNTINLNSVDSGIYGVYGINHNKVNIQSTTGGSLSVIGPSQRNGYIYGIGSSDMEIENCTVTVTTGNSTGDSCVGIAIPPNGSLSIKNATVTANAGDAKIASHGIQVYKGSLSIEHSIVTANGRNSENSAYGSYGIITLNDTSTTISASTVTATGKTSALWFNGATNAPVAPNAVGHTAIASANIDGIGAAAVTLDANVYGLNSTYKYVQIAPAPLPQARWGAAGSDGSAPEESTWVNSGTLTDAMAYANGLGSGTTYIQLQSDVNLSAALDFVSGKTTILDLNGKKIDRGLTTATLDGIVVNVSGSLTLKDSSTAIVANQGKITGGYSSGPGSSYGYTSGCVNVKESASFTMLGGNITGNKTTSSSSGGGGVYVKTSGSFIMTGGSIANNEALNWGGGVYANGSFTMLGGSITGNKSLNGGIYFSSLPFTVGGTAVIDDNMVTGSSVERNVVRFQHPIMVHSTTPLATGAFIGVSANTWPTSGSFVNVTGTNSSNYSSYFHSDNSGYMIQNGASNVVQLAVAAPVIGTLTISDSFTAGHNLTLSELNSKYKPSITAHGVAITAEGWQTPNGLGEWTTWSEGFIPLDTSGTYKLRYYASHADGTVYSNEVTLSVVGNTTSLALTATPESQQNTGTPVTLTATLTDFFAPAPLTGQKIIFKSGTENLGEGSLSASGVATYTWTPLTAGSYSLTAKYAATEYNKAATSNTLSYTVNAALPTAEAYATDAAHGTDYVLDGTNKILTINTDKGAAFWSANGTSYLDYTILLANDVDVSGFSWTPVGDASGPSFTGTFNGQGRSITGLTISTDSYAGLFSRTSRATIKNLCISGSVTISNGLEGSYGGALVAYATGSTIANCCSHTDVTVTESGATYDRIACAGGLLGSADSATAITNCFNTGSVRAAASGATGSRAFAGGIAGDNYESNIINCYSIGNVTAATASEIYTGGVVGRSGDGTVENCYYLSSAAGKGIGNVWGSPTITGCCTIGSDKTTLTAGTADQFVSAQTLAYTATLLESLNGWVDDEASANYNTWKADSGNTNGGYPVLNAAWSALNLTGVGYDVAAGKLTGTMDNMQYSLDGGSTWQDCAVDNTSGLVFAVGTVKVRQKDKTTNERTVGTIAPAATSNAPTLGSKTYNSVTLTVMTGYEYSKDNGATWQDSNLFSGLNSSTAYSFVARIKATAATLSGTVSAVLDVTTNEAPSGNGDSNDSGSTTPPSTKPTEPVTGNIENKATVDNKGNASVSLTDKNIIDAIANAKSEAAKKGVNAGDITTVIHVTTGGKNAETVIVNLPKTTQEQVIGNRIASILLVIDHPGLTIGLDLAAITEINRQAKADVQLSATRVDNTKLSGDAKAAIGNRPAYDFKALYGSGKSVTDFGKGSVSVEIPYTLQKGELAGNVYAVFVDTNGKVTYLTDSSYNAKRGTVVFSTSHFSTYGVAYKDSFNFIDIADHWAKDDILFVANRGLMTGTSATTFSPDGSMTRGMFVKDIGRLANADISDYRQSSFTDVKADSYYMGYIEWGVKNNILVGIGGGKFDPDGFVTREQMAVIMDRYAAAIGFKLPEVHTQNVFADNAKIGAWAAPSVKRIQMAGIIQGKGNNLYDPQGTATRAEVSAVLSRFVELAISSDTAQDGP